MEKTYSADLHKIKGRVDCILPHNTCPVRGLRVSATVHEPFNKSIRADSELLICVQTIKPIFTNQNPSSYPVLKCYLVRKRDGHRFRVRARRERIPFVNCSHETEWTPVNILLRLECENEQSSKVLLRTSHTGPLIRMVGHYTLSPPNGAATKSRLK